MATTEARKVKYKEGYKYQLYKNEVTQTYIRPPSPIVTEYITLMPDGLLIIKKGYAWDGASGPTINTKSLRTPSLIHDALYQLLRERQLVQAWRKDADNEFIRLCAARGVWKIRRWWLLKGLRIFGAKHANPQNAKKVLTVP